MYKRLFRVLALTCVFLQAVPTVLCAQVQENSTVIEEVPQRDTVAVQEGPSAEERLMAKVDSLRRSLAESAQRRRQGVMRVLATADSLCLMYDFPAAVDVLSNAAKDSDSTTARAVEEASLRANAGLRMMNRVSQVTVTARKRISLEDFHGMFPGTDNEEGLRFHASSRDGQSLYFTAKDRSGAGGYDLYVSRRNSATGEWSESVNMGFPYSSPYNDLLYADTGDGRHSVLVSDRDCPPDSVNVYVLEYDPVPPRRPVGEARELRVLAGLEPAGGRRAPAPARRTRSGVDMSAYTAKTAAVRSLRDSVSLASREIDALRAALSEVAEEDREAHVAAILVKELRMEGIRDRLDAASKELQDIELEFLSGGTSPVQSFMQAPVVETADGESAPELFLAEQDGRTVLKLTGSGSGAPSDILPEGTFDQYVEFPIAPAFRVRITVPDDDALPPLALTVIRLYTRTDPEAATKDGFTEYISAPVNGRERAESLMMALRATGADDISLVED